MTERKASSSTVTTYKGPQVTTDPKETGKDGFGGPAALYAALAVDLSNWQQGKLQEAQSLARMLHVDVFIPLKTASEADVAAAVNAFLATHKTRLAAASGTTMTFTVTENWAGAMRQLMLSTQPFRALAPYFPDENPGLMW